MGHYRELYYLDPRLYRFPLRFEGAWVPYKAEKTTCFLEKTWGWFPSHCRQIVVCINHVGCTSFL